MKTLVNLICNETDIPREYEKALFSQCRKLLDGNTDWEMFLSEFKDPDDRAKAEYLVFFLSSISGRKLVSKDSFSTKKEVNQSFCKKEYRPGVRSYDEVAARFGLQRGLSKARLVQFLKTGSN